MKQIEPYVAKQSTLLEYPCEEEACGSIANWRVNASGIDGAGMDFCEQHAMQILQQPGNEQLLEKAQETMNG